MRKIGIGIVGLGNISGAYIKASRSFPVLDIRAVADLNPATAEACAAENGFRAVSLDALYADPAIDIVLNLTVPKAHIEVGLRALDAGKHVYAEKPLGIAFAEGKKLMDAAKARGLRVGSAPDTFLGGSHQTARALIDAGRLGSIVGGTAFFMCPGHESWHPNPAFYYEVGGGPMLDMGPYYITDLVNLLGPVAKVFGASSKLRDTRTITSEPRNGEVIPVDVPTHVTGTLIFQSGAMVQIATSFDVPGHKHVPIEIYGTDASLTVPDPNQFGGQIEIHEKGGEWSSLDTTEPYADDNYRSIGLADMALAVAEDRPHRASGDLALHVLEVMEAFQLSSDSGRTIDITTPVERPAPLAESLRAGELQ